MSERYSTWSKALDRMVGKSGDDPAVGVGREYEPPARARVLEEIPHSGIVQFACHAEVDPADLTRSGLLLQDYDRTPLTMSMLGAENLRLVSSRRGG